MSFFGIPMRNGLSLGLGTVASLTNGPPFLPSELFYNGTVQGAWYDPSDLTTLFQDSAGTTPATAVEQPVGLMLDKRVPVAQTGYYSGVFDGTGDYLDVASNSAFGYGTGDFTIEFWAFFTSISAGTPNLIDQRAGVSAQIAPTLYLNAGTLTYYTNGANRITGSLLSVNIWYHIALCRASGNTRLFVNGTQVGGTFSDSNSYINSPVRIFASNDSGAPVAQAGYCSNLRIIKGTALYTGTFTPPTAPLTVVSGTSLLTCQNATFIDNSSNGFAITANGDAKTGARNPFGNHAYQTTSASRPTLRARYNLLTYSEQFDNAAWGKGNASVTANTSVAPDGTTTADTFTSANSNAQHYLQPNAGASINTPNVNYTNSISVKAGTHNFVTLSFSSGGATAWAAVTVNLSTGQITQTANGAAGTLVSSSIASQGNGWYRVTFTASYASGGPGLYLWVSSSSSGTPTYGNYGMEFWAAAGTETILVWGAQLVPTAVFPSNTYQRVGAATDYATGAAFPPYLFCDGIDDSMLTNSVDFATVTSDGQARRNLLSNPTQFDDAAWSTNTGSVAITANQTTAPDGTNTADLITEAAGARARTGFFYAFSSPLASAAYTYSVYVKQNTGSRFVRVILNTATATVFACVDINPSTGVITQTLTAGAVTNVSSSVANVGNGWYRVSITGTQAFQYVTVAFVTSSTTPAGADFGYESYTGSTANSVFVWGTQLETGSTATAFQNIGTDKMLVVAGVTRQSSASGLLAELGPDIGANNGTWYMFPFLSGDLYYGSRGTTLVQVFTPFATPESGVFSGVSNIGAPTVLLRKNGVQAATSSASQGTGNYGNYPLFIGRRNNATLPLNGQIYSLVIAGQSYSAGQISSTESWVAAKTPLGTI